MRNQYKDAVRITIGGSIFIAALVAGIFCIDPTRYETIDLSIGLTLVLPMVGFSAIVSGLIADKHQRRTD